APVFQRADTGSWDSYAVATPAVIRNSGTSYELWYTGMTATSAYFRDFLKGTVTLNDAVRNGFESAIGHATSADGISWTRDGSAPVVARGSGEAWDGSWVAAPSVIKVGNTLQMWYTSASADPKASVNAILDGAGIMAALSASEVAVGYAYSGERTLASIAVTPASTSVGVGKTRQFTATAVFSDGSTEDIRGAADIVWTSSTAKASVSSTGLATGLELGSTLITAARAGVTSNQAVLSVTAAELSSITVSPDAPTVPLGRSLPFSATGVYSDGSSANLTALATWSSSVTAKATISSSGVATGRATGTTTIAAAYSGVSGSTVLTVGEAELTSFAVTPDGPSVAGGNSLQFTASEYYSDGSVINRSAGATWSSSSPEVASITGSGLASALTAGSTTITATYGDNSDSTLMTVTAPALQSVAIDEASPAVAAGNTLQLHLTGTYSDNTTAELTSDAGTVWASLDLARATVSGAGLVTGVAEGAVTIRATNNGLRATVQLTVSPATLASISVTPASPKATLGRSVQFAATGTYTDGSTRDITGTVTWSSDNTTVASISAGGLAAAAAEGTSIIGAASGGVTGTTTMTVTPATLTGIAVTPAGSSVAAGRITQLTATGTFSDTSTADITGMVTWTSLNSSVATINNTGLATGVTAGSTATVRASLGAVNGTTTLSVTAAVLDSIAVTPASPSVAAGKARQFTATGTYSNATTADITALVTWESASTEVATIAGSGLATTLVPGTASISAALSGKTGDTTLTVTAASLESVTVAPGSFSVAAGGTKQFTATGVYSNGTAQDLTAAAIWSSSNGALATVASGLARGRAVGAPTIAAVVSGKSGSAVLTVTAATLDSLTISPLNPRIAPGDSRQFRAVGAYTDGTIKDVTAQAAWTSGNTLVATIGLNTGLAAGIAAGTADITASLDARTADTALAVSSATLSSLAVTPATASVAAGQTRQYTATGTYSDTTTADLTAFVTWTSGNTDIARVNAAGLAATYLEGTAGVTAALSGVTSPAAELTVTAPVLSSVKITPVSPVITFVSGTPPTMQFTSTGINSDGSTASVTGSATWSSDNTSVATVSGSGLVTTVAAGTAVISAEKSGKSDGITLTVLPDTVAPVITLTSPAEGAIRNDKSLTVRGRVDDKLAAASLIVNGGAPLDLTLDEEGALSKGVLLNSGSNTVLVKALDAAGNTGTSGTRTVVVDAAKPAIVIDSPQESALTNDADLTVTGTITGATTASLVLNGTGQAVTPVEGAFSAGVTLGEGTNIIVVKAYTTGHENDADYLGTSGTRRVVLDSTAPTVTITSPVSGAVVSAPEVTVAGTVNDPSATSAVLTLNGVPLTVTVAGGSFSQPVTLSAGSNAITVVATDRAGNASAASPVTVTLDTSKPQVAITSPENKFLTNGGVVNVTGTVDDPSITSVTLYLNGSGTSIPIASSGDFNALVSLVSGDNSIEVRATNNAEPPTTGTSGVITVTRDTTAPVLSIGLSDPADSIIITVAANEALAAPPSVTVDGAITMTAVDINKWSGVYGSSASPIAAGAYTVTVTGTDKAGNGATRTATFTRKSIDVDGVAATRVETATTTMDVQTNGAVSGAAISVTQHLDNPSGNVGNPSGAGNSAGVFLEINTSPELRDNLKQIEIRVSYDPAELPAGTNESSLKLYLWDVASGTWQAVPGSGVNTGENYIYGIVTHLSKYGGFGSATVSPPPSGGPGGGGGGPAPGITSLSGMISFTGKLLYEVVATSDDGRSTLLIPANSTGLKSNGLALDRITMTRLSQAPASVPAYQTVIGELYDFGPDGARFQPSATLAIKYDATMIPAGVTADKIYIAFWDNSAAQWVALPSTADTAAGIVRAPVAHFTRFTVMVSARPASFTVTNLTVNPASVNPDEAVTVSAVFANTGDVGGTYNAVLKINDVVEQSREISIGGGVSQQVVFTAVRSTPGTYQVDISGQAGSFTVAPPAPPAPTPPAPAAVFRLNSLAITPELAASDALVSISIQVTNAGTASGSYEALLKINNQVIETKRITLAAGASERVSFNTSGGSPGIYVVDINGIAGQFIVGRAAAFVVSEFTVAPSEIPAGERATVTVLVTNTGDFADKYVLTLKTGETVVGTREVTLEGGASERVSFVVSGDTSGVLSLDINGLQGSLIVREAEGAGNRGLLWLAIAGVTLLLIALAFLVIRRRRYPV
ncbi:MAG: Ig-like domain-containing protein, partial [Chloroflexi bacterium]|nr:Ig-like domain-containing protein [Chloroflexota bacterium]